VTNLGFSPALVQNRDYVRADFDTGLNRAPSLRAPRPVGSGGEDALTLAALSELDAGLGGEARRPGERFSPWSQADAGARTRTGVRLSSP